MKNKFIRTRGLLIPFDNILLIYDFDDFVEIAIKQNNRVQTERVYPYYDGETTEDIMNCIAQQGECGCNKCE